MAEKRSTIANFFSFRTSYFNTNIQAAGDGNAPLFEFGDSVDNTTKKRRQNQQQQNNTTTTTNDEKQNNNNNSNSTVVEVTTEVTTEDQDQQQEQDTTTNNEEIENTDVISDLLGHFGWWQFIWCVTLSLFQFPSTFHLFSFVFEVRLDRGQC